MVFVTARFEYLLFGINVRTSTIAWFLIPLWATVESFVNPTATALINIKYVFTHSRKLEWGSLGVI